MYFVAGAMCVYYQEAINSSVSPSVGYPAPELKWYKDDMEIDRYCGLPKYEIRRNGKTHTLHIYKYVEQIYRSHLCITPV